MAKNTKNPVSDIIFKYEENGYPNVAATLRVFLASEYDRDPTILERLQKWLDEMMQAHEERLT